MTLPQFWGGIGLGVLSAASQATSVLAARPVMALQIDGMAAMSVRLGSAAVVLALVVPFIPRKNSQPLTPRLTILSVLGAVIGVGAGVTCVFTALQHGDVATVVTFAALTPVAVLPLVWIRTRKAPSWPAWLGALIAFSGAALIANN